MSDGKGMGGGGRRRGGENILHPKGNDDDVMRGGGKRCIILGLYPPHIMVTKDNRGHSGKEHKKQAAVIWIWYTKPNNIEYILLCPDYGAFRFCASICILHRNNGTDSPVLFVS